MHSAESPVVIDKYAPKYLYVATPDGDPWDDYREAPSCGEFCYHSWARDALRLVGLRMPKRATEETDVNLRDLFRK